MMNVMGKRSKKLGAPPGTLIYTGLVPPPKTQFHLIEYDATFFHEKKEATLVDCMKSALSDKTTWIHVSGLSDPKIMESIGAKFKLNPLLMEDVLNTGQRPKCDDYRDHIYIVVRLFRKNSEGPIHDEQLSIVLGSRVILTFSESLEDFFEPIRARIRKEGSRMRMYGADYLAYAILDMSVDYTFVTLEKIDEAIQHLDELLMAKPEVKTLYAVEKIKREISLLRKNIWPLREVISRLERKELPLIGETVRFFFKDVYDHSVQVIETLEGQRDIVSGMIDIYLSNISMRLNEVMKFLTIVSTIFVPLTFIASVYGMNFTQIPGLSDESGFAITIGCMLTIAIGMLFFFRRKHWL